MKRMTKEEKQALTARLFAEMPELPETLEKDVRKWALKERYLFYTYDKKQGISTAVCTNCGKTVELKRVLRHTTQERLLEGREFRAVCPACREVGVTMEAWRGHKGLMDSALYMVIQAGAGGCLWVRVLEVRRRYPDSVGPFVTEYSERLRVYLNAETHEAFRWKKEMVPDMEHCYRWDWALSGIVNSNLTAEDCYRFGRIQLKENAETAKELAKTAFRYADFLTMAKEHPQMDKIMYLALFAKNPDVEKLVKAGFGGFVAEKCSAGRGSETSAINWRAHDLKGFFRGESRDTISALRRCRSLREAGQYICMKKLLGLGVQGVDFGKARRLYEYREFIEKMTEELGTVKRCEKYVRGQVSAAKKAAENACGRGIMRIPREEDIWNLWRDYARIAHACGIELSGKELTPPDIYKAHDEMTELHRVQREAALAAKRRKEEEGLAGNFEKRMVVLQKFAYEKGGLLIRPCETPHEMTEEGIRLRHCVGTYLHRHANGTSNIFLIRKAEEPGVPYYTLELSKELDRVVQWYGYEDNRNIQKDPAVKEFIGDWMAEIVLPKKRGKKKDRKQAPAGQVENRQPLAAAV